MEAFGPVPSRRLGQSLGINNIPAKACSYGCTYCQLGRTNMMQIRRQLFYDPEEVVDVVRAKVDSLRARGESIDYLSFVPDGEATLDINLGREIDMLRFLDIDIAVITNASLIDDPDVQHELARADLVSVKVDALSDRAWRAVDRPHGKLILASILEGVEHFAKLYQGRLLTETLLVDGANDSEEEVAAVAEFVAGLDADFSYICIPTRPPTESWAQAPDEDSINRAFQIFTKHVNNVECLLGMETGAFGSTGNIETDILGITAVHPMRRAAVGEMLERAGEDWAIIDKMVADEKIVELTHNGDRFYFRKLPNVKRKLG
jgi:wyosine [tRNA(Phe)-imidazoG37] synthetase (radical SAM superfamily)